MSPELEKKVREKLGDGIGIAFIEDKLSYSIPELFEWMRRYMRDTDSPIGQTLANAYVYSDMKDRRNEALLKFGITILEHHFKTMLFFLEEVRERIAATETPQTNDTGGRYHMVDTEEAKRRLRELAEKYDIK